MKTIYKIVFFLALITAFNNATAKVSIPEIFASNMVLQQNSEVKFWGWAKSNEPVSISADWLDEAASTKASNEGKWELVVKTPKAGGPFTVKIKGYNEIVLDNVLLGEVWLVSGQSNMEWSANSGITNGDAEIAEANYPKIRLFTVLNSSAECPQNHFDGQWVTCSPETMREFSAIGYFFGEKLHQDLEVPIGIINSSWGGTPAETWMPEETIENDDFLKNAAALLKTVPWGPVESGRLYNAMIAPMVPFQIAGALWYQGEANTANYYAYTKMLSALIESWRAKFNHNFPFYLAQIAPYKYGKPFEGVEVREAQRKVLELPKTAMVVTSDIGDTTDIHPKNKKDVGLRFANIALNRHYKTIDVVDCGPLFQAMEVEKNKAIISFENAKGLHAKGDEITCFEIAGSNGVFYPADAKIQDDKVIVQSKEVKTPKKVRFAWRNTATPNLFNGAGLPASCFRAE